MKPSGLGEPGDREALETRTRGPAGRCGRSAAQGAMGRRTDLLHAQSFPDEGKRGNHVRKGGPTVKLLSLKVASVMNHNEEAHCEVHPCCVKRKLERIWQFLSVMLEVTNNNEKPLKNHYSFKWFEGSIKFTFKNGKEHTHNPSCQRVVLSEAARGIVK